MEKTQAPTDALVLLTGQHEQLDTLIAKIERAKTAETRRPFFVEMADLLAAHATIEEKVLYPAIKDKKTEDKLLEAVEEHLSVKRLLADMLEMRVTNDHFDAKLSVLKEQLSHHNHDEEEEELFPLIRKMTTKEDLLAIGAEMVAMFDELMKDSPRKAVPSEIDVAAAV